MTIVAQKDDDSMSGLDAKSDRGGISSQAFAGPALDNTRRIP